MHIAFDYTAGIRQEAGIGHYVRSLLAAMLALDKGNQYTLITSGRPTRERPFPAAPNVRGRGLLIPDRYVNVLWYRWRAPLPAHIFTGQVDIYHGPDFVLPPLSKKIRKVVTIHDLAFLEHPEYAVPSLVEYLKKVVPISLAEADVVAAVSHYSAQTLIEHFQTPREKIVVVPNGLRPHFRRITDPVLLGATVNKFGLKHPLVLGVGTLQPRKNHQGLIKAFHRAQSDKKNRPAMLALAGEPGWLYDETRQLIADLKLEKKVRFLGRTNDLELCMLYSLADVFAFPSFFEGFGVPPLEAMACGAPVITSNTSSLPEVVGDAALTVDPHNIDALAQAITRLIGDENLREELRQKGYARAQLYTWPKSAQKMLDTYQKLYNGATNFSGEAMTV
ncbi:MAG TPA: glycosyltransferase family 1 protein [Ktedonobacteraceae bacterium]|nr:glycosyltransferase family 1 protein [Ktedonobacteraceae bacterium]